MIFDEIQHVPTLLSYIQGVVDNNKDNGQFVLTGSHRLELREAVSQSLAGRTGVIHLLPLSIEELKNAQLPVENFESCIYTGFLPRIHAGQQRRSIA